MLRRLLVVVVMMASSASAGIVLKVDFNSDQDGGGNSTTAGDPGLSAAAHNQAGWSSYHANHEVAAEFSTANYGGITVTPAWPNTTDNRVEQSIDRGAANDATWNNAAGDLNLVTDFIGTDTRTANGGNGNWDGATGTPTYMTLTLGGLPAGAYEWTSFHHDTEHAHGPFAVWLSTDGGATFTQLADGLMTDGTTGGTPDSGAPVSGPDAYSLASTYRTSFIADGTNDVVMRFAPYANSTGVHRQIWGMNGFELKQVDTDLAFGPTPTNGATDVETSVVLSWRPGNSTATTNGHKIFLSDSLADVSNGLAAAERGVVSDPVFDTAALGFTLEFDTTYYWRVDQASTPGGPWKAGVVWSFTMEPYSLAIPGALITATASSKNSANEEPNNTIDGSGLNADDLHSVELVDMWLSSAADANAARIQYEFDKGYKLHQVWIWNHNSVLEPGIGFGVKNATIEYSTDGTKWATLGTTHVFNPAPGAAGYAHNTTIDFGGVVAKYVKITANSNWGGKVAQYGLGEVRFFYIPVWAREPNPASGAADTEMDNVTLSWRAGREAASHDLYLSTSRQAVIDETISPVSVSGSSSYDTGELNLGQTYYWKVNEVNTAETPATWQGDVWDFSTKQYLVIDDFESYDDDYKNYNRIFQVWIDGAGYDQPGPGRPGNGSGAIVGTNSAPWVEQTIVHGGSGQSMPFYYNNSAASYSEATANVADLAAGQNWTKYGIKALTLWFYGDPNNSVTERMYVKLNGSKVTYDGDGDNLKRWMWQQWNIDLKDFAGVNLSNVTQLSIGFERSGGAGGSGLVYFDDIRLHPARCVAEVRQPGADLNDDCVVDYLDLQIIANQWLSSGLLVTPLQPSTAGLVAHYEFEGTTNDSAGANHGISTGDPGFVAGKVGQAISLDGLNDYVAVEGSYLLASYTVAMWFRVDGGAGNRDLFSAYDSAGGHGILLEVTGTGTLRFLHRFPFGTGGGTSIYTSTAYADGAWYHAVIVKSADTMTLYVDGQRIGSAADSTQFSQALQRLTLGVLKHDSLTRYFPGAFDDVYLYSRALTYGEVAGLAGRTEPFSESFDLNVDGAVDFSDYATLCGAWLDEQLWP